MSSIVHASVFSSSSSRTYAWYMHGIMVYACVFSSSSSRTLELQVGWGWGWG